MNLFVFPTKFVSHFGGNFEREFRTETKWKLWKVLVENVKWFDEAMHDIFSNSGTREQFRCEILWFSISQKPALQYNLENCFVLVVSQAFRAVFLNLSWVNYCDTLLWWLWLLKGPHHKPSELQNCLSAESFYTFYRISRQTWKSPTIHSCAAT